MTRTVLPRNEKNIKRFLRASDGYSFGGGRREFFFSKSWSATSQNASSARTLSGKGSKCRANSSAPITSLFSHSRLTLMGFPGNLIAIPDFPDLCEVLELSLHRCCPEDQQQRFRRRRRRSIDDSTSSYSQTPVSFKLLFECFTAGWIVEYVFQSGPEFTF